MKASRRGFLGMFAAAPIVGPSLAKEAANLSDLKIKSTALSGKPFDCDKDTDDWGPIKPYKAIRKPGYRQRLTALMKQSNFFKSKGVPDFQRRKWFEDYNCNRLDADLAVNRSMSLTAKLHIQRERDWKKREHELLSKSYEKYCLLNNIHNKKLKREMVKLGLMEKNDYMPSDDNYVKQDPSYYDDSYGDDDD